MYNMFNPVLLGEKGKLRKKSGKKNNPNKGRLPKKGLVFLLDTTRVDRHQVYKELCRVVMLRTRIAYSTKVFQNASSLAEVRELTQRCQNQNVVEKFPDTT